MKNLLSKLQPVYKAKLCDVKEVYPAMFKSIMDTLETKNYVIDLTINEARHLVMYLDEGRSFGDIYNLFKLDHEVN